MLYKTLKDIPLKADQSSRSYLLGMFFKWDYGAEIAIYDSYYVKGLLGSGKKIKRRERNKKKIIINGIKRLKCASFLVLYNCRDKEPDKCGEGRYLEGWKDTVMSARLNAGVWLEHALYQRFRIAKIKAQ